jgi:DNA polymerase-3 subunit delta
MAATPPTVYMLYGDHEIAFDEFIHSLRERLGDPQNAEMNIDRIPADSLDLDRIEQIASTVPFLTRRRVLIVEHPSLLMKSEEKRERFFNLLRSLPQTTAIVLIEPIDFRSTRGRIPTLSGDLIQWLEDHPSSYIRRLEAPHGPRFSDWIQDHAQQQGGEIQPQAAHLLAESVAEEIQFAHEEIVKLLTYVNFERPVEVSDVENLTPFHGQSNIFDMVDAIGKRDAQTALQNFQLLLEVEYPLYIFSMVVRQFRLLLQAKIALLGKQDPQAVLKISPFIAKKSAAQARNFSLSDLENIFQHLLKMDFETKIGRNDLEVALERLIIQLAR